MTLRKLATAIRKSPAWSKGNNALVVVWDENDCSTAPNVNQVPVIVDTNYASGGVKSSVFYTHFSLLKSIEGGLGLPCLNHARDSDAATMSDLLLGKGPKQNLNAQDERRGIGIPPVPGASAAAGLNRGP